MKYLVLAKPGIIFGNLLTAAAGFALGAHKLNGALFASTLIGLALVIASGCALNNYFDRIADSKMTRTKKRPLVTGAITPPSALLFAALAGLSGLAILYSLVNPLSAFLSLIGLFAYVVLYGYSKYRTPLATLIGSIAGAIPPLVGYTAASNTLDTTALLLFTILVFWQMPHFYAIAIFRLHEYNAAAIPVLPAAKGLRATKIEMTAYVILFTFAALSPILFHYQNLPYLISAALLCLGWLYLSLKGFSAPSDTIWAHSMFRYSLLVVTLLSAAIGLDKMISPS